MTASETLPNFTKPPVEEVACSLQFAMPLPLGLVDFGSLVAAYRPLYPQLEEQPPLPPISTGPEQVAFQFQFGMATIQLPRLWLLNETGNSLVQLQRDRLGVNWRRTKPQDVEQAYPRYRIAVRPSLVDAHSRLVEGLAGMREAAPSISAFEVVYVNPIPMSADQHPSDILRCLTSDYGGALSEPTDGLNLQLTFPLVPLDGTLTVTAGLARRADDSNDDPLILLMQLTARGTVPNGTFESALDCVDVAHDSIVRGFASLTTDEMHMQWGRL